MTRTDCRLLLIRRRELTGETFNDGTIDAWTETFPALTLDVALTTMGRAARTRDRVTVHAFTEALPPRPLATTEPPADPDFTPVPADRVRQLLAEGIEQGRAQRFARAVLGDPVVLARLEWWRAGGDGHYPGCTCKRCRDTALFMREDRS
jgi:hypothetical protein